MRGIGATIGRCLSRPMGACAKMLLPGWWRPHRRVINKSFDGVHCFCMVVLWVHSGWWSDAGDSVLESSFCIVVRRARGTRGGGDVGRLAAARRFRVTLFFGRGVLFTWCLAVGGVEVLLFGRRSFTLTCFVSGSCFFGTVRSFWKIWGKWRTDGKFGIKAAQFAF